MTALTQRKPAQFMPSAKGGNFAVMTCHFNFGGFTRPRQNLCRFVRQMHTAGVPVFGIELHRSTEQPFTLGWENWTAIECAYRSIMFQKEALLNVLEKLVPDQYDMLGWFDGDVMLGNPEWTVQIQELLKEFKVVQAFSKCHFTDKDGSVMFAWPGCVTLGEPDFNKSHTGFAWAAQRSLWRNGGLYPFSITGAGDVILAASFLNCPLRQDYVDSLGVDGGGLFFREWDARVRRWCNGEVAYVHGDLFHEWHGSHKNRRYVERRAMLETFDPAKHVFLNSDEILQWHEDAPITLVEYIRDYFASRAEDS